MKELEESMIALFHFKAIRRVSYLVELVIESLLLCTDSLAKDIYNWSNTPLGKCVIFEEVF